MSIFDQGILGTSGLILRAEVRIDFIKEMQRFLPVQTVKQTVEREELWEFLTGQVKDLIRLAVRG